MGSKPLGKLQRQIQISRNDCSGRWDWSYIPLQMAGMILLFEQIKKQLNRMVEVIKVIDFTNMFVRMKEILYIKVFNCSSEDKVELFQIAETFKARVIDYGKDSLLLEFVQTATKNDAVVKLIKEEFGRIEVVRGGSVGIESISMMER